MVLLEGIELSTSPLPRECSTTELQQRLDVSGGRYSPLQDAGASPQAAVSAPEGGQKVD